MAELTIFVPVAKIAEAPSSISVEKSSLGITPPTII